MALAEIGADPLHGGLAVVFGMAALAVWPRGRVGDAPRPWRVHEIVLVAAAVRTDDGRPQCSVVASEAEERDRLRDVSRRGVESRARVGNIDLGLIHEPIPKRSLDRAKAVRGVRRVAEG